MSQKKKLNFLFKYYLNNNYIIFFLFVFCLIIANILFSKIYLLKNPHLLDENNNFLLIKLSNGFGELIKHLYQGNPLTITWLNDMELVAARRLFVPYFLFISEKIFGENFLLIHLFKNILFGILIFFTIKFYKNNLKNTFLIIALILIYYLPYNNLNSFTIEKEEGWLNYFMILLFFFLIGDNKYKSIYLGIIISLIFFLKESMFFLTLSIPILFIIFEKKAKYKFIPFIAILFSNLVWGTYIYNKASYFAIGAKGSSISSTALYLVTTKEFNETYPDIVPDIYYFNAEEIIKKENIKNEKQMMEKFFTISKEYILNNPVEYFNGLIKKLYVLLFNPYKDAQIPYSNNNTKNFDYKNYKSNNTLRISNIFNKTIFNLSLILLFITYLKKKNNQQIKKINYYYFFVLLFYLFPYMVAFIYDRHATGIYILSHLYILTILTEIYKKKFKN